MKKKVTEVLDKVESLERDMKTLDRLCALFIDNPKDGQTIEDKIDYNYEPLSEFFSRVKNNLYVEKTRLMDILNKTEVDV